MMAARIWWGSHPDPHFHRTSIPFNYRLKTAVINCYRQTHLCLCDLPQSGRERCERDLERFHITSRALHLIGNGNINGIDLAYFDRTPEVMRQRKSIAGTPVSLFASSDDWCGIKVSTNWFQLLSACNRNLQTVVFA